MAAATLENVAKLYVATFNRAPDFAGLNWWINSSGFTLEQIAQSFFDQTETQTLYPSGTTTTTFVTAVYDNLFNRAPDAGGLSYWVSELDNGRVSNQNFILAVINGALDSDATILANKTTVGLAYVNAELNDTTLARSVMANVDATDASVTAALNTITQNAPTDTSFQLTEAWLAGKTLYNVYDDGNNGTAETDTMTFYANGTGFIAGEYGSGNFTYSVDANGVLTMTGNEDMIEDGISYIKAIQMDDTIDNAIRIEWTTDYADAATYTAGEGYEYLATTVDAATVLQQLIEGNASSSNVFFGV